MGYFAPYFKIETFGAVDGPGVRLVIFLQGCPYRCIYCHNPESWKINNKKNLISVDEVIKKYERSKEFYKNGGITISGGEPLIHKNFCLELAKQCILRKIHLAFDTSGCTFQKQNLKWFNQLIKFKPYWLIDIKHIDRNKHKIITGFNNLNEISLIKFLEKNHQHYWIRQVLVPNFTDHKTDLMKLRDFINKLKYMDNFELLPYHELAIHKYKDLNIKYELKNKTHIPSSEEMRTYNKIFINKK